MRASSLPLLTKCVGSLILPCDHTKSANAKAGADWGSMVHHWAETGEIKGPTKRLETAFEKAIELSGMRGRRLEYWPDGGVHEGSVSVRVDGVLAPSGSPMVSRDDTPREGWITGHYDYHAWIWDGELWIDDLKTGKYYPNPESGLPGWDPRFEVGGNRFPQDVLSPQLKTYALALCELLEYRGDVHVSVTHWPRLPLSYRHARPTREWTKYSYAELMEFHMKLEQMYLDAKHNEEAYKLFGDTLILKPGDHCRFCPARACCFVAQKFE